MTHRRCLQTLLPIVLIVAACGESVTPEPTAPKDDPGSGLLAGQALPALSESGGMLPAYQTETEIDEAGKADALDVRASFEAIYGVTRGPSRSVRAVAEWEPSDAVLLSWQDGMDDFMVDMVAAMHRVAPVYLITPSASFSRSLDDYFAQIGLDTSRIHTFEYPHEAFWTRDFGPVTVELSDGAPAFVDFSYYSNRRRDDAVPTLMGSYFNVPVYRPPLASEGGNFMVNGEGLCAVTTWMYEENPSYNSNGLGAEMRNFLGCERTIVLERLAGEGTGHIDMFAKFTQPDTVLVGAYDASFDPVNAAILDRNAERFAAVELADGRRLRVVRIPMPTYYADVYPSFTNSLLLNGTAFVPRYSHARDLERQVTEAYLAALPDGFEVVFIDSTQVIEWGGAIHCTAMAFNVSRPAPSALNNGTPPTPPAGNDALSSHAALPIRDGEVTSDTIDVSGTGLVSGAVRVSVDISHTYVGDLLIVLEHDGVQAVLYEGQGPGHDLVQRFASDAFRDTSVGGAWVLHVADRAAQDEGTLESWSLAL